MANPSETADEQQGELRGKLLKRLAMAGLLVATRVTGKVLKKAQQDFASVELDYARLIERREAAIPTPTSGVPRAGIPCRNCDLCIASRVCQCSAQRCDLLQLSGYLFPSRVPRTKRRLHS